MRFWRGEGGAFSYYVLDFYGGTASDFNTLLQEGEAS